VAYRVHYFYPKYIRAPLRQIDPLLPAIIIARLQLLATAVLADSQRQDFQRPSTRATAVQAMSKCLRISRLCNSSNI